MWDLSELQLLLKQSRIESDLTVISPVSIDTDFVKFCYVKFNIKSIIHSNANSEDVIKGFNLLMKDLDKVFEYLNKIYLARLFDESKYPISLEPSVADLLRFFYWYYKCSLIWTQANTTSKKSEVSSKITRKFLKAFEIYYQSLNYEGLEFKNKSEFDQWVEKERENVTPARSKRHAKYEKILRALREAVKKITSELMLAAICAMDHNVEFDKMPSTDHDYDFVLESIGVQVKTLSDEYGNFKKGEIEAYMTNLKTNGKIDQKKIVTAFFEYIMKENRLETLEKAIEQQARIIFVNLSDTLIGIALMNCVIDNKLGNTFEYSLVESIKLSQSDNTSYLPCLIILAHTGYDYYFDGFLSKSRS